MSTLTAELLDRLEELASRVDEQNHWPEQQLNWLAEAGILGWTIPHEFGGSDVSAATLMRGYEELASACLVTTFILTQRNAACQRLVLSENRELQADLLPDLATGKSFATVGISHLSTSRQHLSQPSVRVTREGGDLRLSGSIPWVTGAAQAQHIVTGGTLEDGQQVLVALPMTEPGIIISPPAQLLALTASQTATVELNDVRIPERMLVAGPVNGVMRQSGGGAGSLGTSALALGLSERSLQFLQQQADLRPDLEPIASQFFHEFDELQLDFDRALAEPLEPLSEQLSSVAIRQRANSLALRVTQAALAISKGAGYVRGHPAERGVREAMFFLVWSCPQPVVLGVLEELACL